MQGRLAMLFIKLLQSLPDSILPKASYKYATNVFAVCCFSVFLVSCVSSGGKSKEPNITRLDEFDLDQVEYADHGDGTEQLDDRFSMPDESDNAEVDPYDNPQYADDTADLYDNPEYVDGETQTVIDEGVNAEDAETSAYDNPEYAEGVANLDGVDLADLDGKAADEVFGAENDTNTNAVVIDNVDEVVYEQVGIDENGLPIMAIVKPIDPLEQFGANPYLQNPPAVTDEASNQFSEAISLMREEKWDEASVILELVSDENPELSGPAYNRAVIAYTQNDLELALKWLNIALDRNAYNLDAKNLKANVFKKQSKFIEAEAEYKGIIALWGAYLPAYKNLGILYDLYMGKFKLAIEQYRLYESLTPQEDKQVVGWIAVIARQLPVEEVVPAGQAPADSVGDEAVIQGASTEAPQALDQLTEGSESVLVPIIDDGLEESSGINVEDSAMPADDQASELPVDSADLDAEQLNNANDNKPAEIEPEVVVTEEAAE